MITISKKAQYGLRAMIFLAKNFHKNNFCSIKTISKEEDIPFHFLEKIFLSLENKKLVKGKRGFGGGYKLNLPPQKITIDKILETLEEEKRIVNCNFCKMTSRCKAKSVWKKLELVFKKSLSSITLFQLIK